MGRKPRASDALERVLGGELYAKLQSCKVLMVGAGGIGCELLKNLVLSGFDNITVIDLDTIEVTNLNRQFLFQKQHVGKPKAVVARESVLRFNPHLNIVAHHADVMGERFDQAFYEGFDLVLNALDNVKARSHVNRMCLAAKRPLVESGSSGYLGQVTVHMKGKFECYECQPKPKAKTFPACTIRNTPSAMIHCIVWAKYLFSDNDVAPSARDVPEDERDDAAAKEQEAHPVKNTRQIAEETDYDAQKLLEKLFTTDVQTLLNLDKLWTKRRKPAPLGTEEISAKAIADTVEKLPDQHVWSLEQCKAKFLESVKALHTRMAAAGSDGLAWDKDDDEALDFVCAAANLRAFVFHIDPDSRFDVKSKAGNIIPAIATTNAVVAGLIVAQAFRILKNEMDGCRAVYLSRAAMGGKKLLSSMMMMPPNPDCFACQEKPACTLLAPIETFTLEKLAEVVLKKELNMAHPELALESGQMILSAPDDEEDEEIMRKKLYPRTLASFGIKDGTRCLVTDDRQRFNVQLTVRNSAKLPEDREFVLERGELEAQAAQTVAAAEAKASKKAKAAAAAASAAVVLDDDDDDNDMPQAETAKRGNADESSEPSGKRAKRSA